MKPTTDAIRSIFTHPLEADLVRMNGTRADRVRAAATR